MESVIPALGPVGFAFFLSAVLIFGTKENSGGKAKPLGWWAVLILSLIAGAAFAAGGWPFDLIPKLLMGDLLGAVDAVMPGLSLPAIALTLMAILAWVGLTRRQVAMLGIFLFYCLAGSDEGLGILAERIHAVAQDLAK